MMKEGDCLHQTVRKMGTKEDWKAFRELRNRVKVALREAEQEYSDQEIHEKENNCGAIWKTNEALCQTRQVIQTSPKTQNDTLANEFNHFLKSVGEKAACDSANLPGRTTYQTSQSLLIFVHHRPLTSCWNSMQ